MPRKSDPTALSGSRELLATLGQSRGLFWLVGLFSVFVNALVLTGPLYMMNVYDRVLGSRSIETLVALTGIAAFLYGIMALLDVVRGRVLSRIASRFEAMLSERTFLAAMRANSLGRSRKEAASALRDLEAIRRLIGSPVVSAL